MKIAWGQKNSIFRKTHQLGNRIMLIRGLRLTGIRGSGIRYPNAHAIYRLIVTVRRLELETGNW